MFIQRLWGNPWVALAVMCLGLFMALLDTTIVNIAVPSIIEGIDASLDEILWVLNAYVLVYAAVLITAGRLGDIFGPRNLFLAGLAVFTVASALCEFAQDPAQLIAARALQGVGGAMLSPQLLAIITSLFPPERRGAAFAVPGIMGGLAVAAGPTLGGLMVTNFGWPQLAEEVFRNGFVDAMHPTLVLPIVVVLLAAIGCFAVRQGKHEARPEEAEQQPVEEVA